MEEEKDSQGREKYISGGTQGHHSIPSERGKITYCLVVNLSSALRSMLQRP